MLLKDDIKVKLKLTEAYRLQNVPKAFERSLTDVKAAQVQQPYRHAEFFYANYQIQLEAYKYTAARKRISDLNLQAVSDDLDCAYLALKLRQTCFSLSHQAVYKARYEFGLLDEVLAYIQQKSLLHISAIAIYYHCYFAMTQPEQRTHFQAFKNLLFTENEKFPLAEMRDVYLLAINICTKHYNEGDQTYLNDLFELYKAGLEQEYLLSNGLLSHFTYRNIVTFGLILRDYNWVESFIHQYKNTLDLVHRESVFSFCLARLEYSRRNYDKALQLLQKSDYEDLLLNLSAKTVLLKIFYELNEFDLLDAHLHAMTTFLNRKKIIGYQKENYQNLLRFTRKLLEFYDASAKAALRENIVQVKALAEREWLLEQLDKL